MQKHTKIIEAHDHPFSLRYLGGGVKEGKFDELPSVTKTFLNRVNPYELIII